MNKSVPANGQTSPVTVAKHSGQDLAGLRGSGWEAVRTGPVLALDTTSATQGLALACRGRQVSQRVFLPAASHTETLVDNITTLLAEQGLRLGDLAGACAVTGPGSFAGIRIGMAAVAGLADALNIPAAGFHALELLARCPGTDDGLVFAIVATRRGKFFGAAYEPAENGPHVLDEPAEYDESSLAERVRSLARPGSAMTLVLDEAHAEVATRIGDRWPASSAGRFGWISPPVPLCSLLLGAVLVSPERWATGNFMPEALYVRPPDAKRNPLFISPAR